MACRCSWTHNCLSNSRMGIVTPAGRHCKPKMRRLSSTFKKPTPSNQYLVYNHNFYFWNFTMIKKFFLYFMMICASSYSYANTSSLKIASQQSTSPNGIASTSQIPPFSGFKKFITYNYTVAGDTVVCTNKSNYCLDKGWKYPKDVVPVGRIFLCYFLDVQEDVIYVFWK